MASDLSSGCTEVIEILDEKEEGEISLEDVSSSEEGQLNYSGSSRVVGQCRYCLSTKLCASWCTVSTKSSHPKAQEKKDAVQEKENCHHVKDSGHLGSKHITSTLQEKNNDLVPISSDSDMEIEGLAEIVKQQSKTNKVRKKRKKRRSQIAAASPENMIIPTSTNRPLSECHGIQKRDTIILKDNHLSRSHHRELSSPHRRGQSPFNRSRVSPQKRHRSPLGRARSPLRQSRSPVLRKSPPRRFRSPKRSPPNSPVRSLNKRLHRGSSPSSHIYAHSGHTNPSKVTKLLKRVRRLKTLGSLSDSPSVSRGKELGSSLKEKLNNILRGIEGNDVGSAHVESKHSQRVEVVGDTDGEEDVALLRRMALETKQSKPDKEQKSPTTDTDIKSVTNSNAIDEEDIEDLELRMIALRSAMIKKHQNRLQKGVTLGKSKKVESVSRNESPFSQSFLDSIPIPGEDTNQFNTTPPRTPTDQLLTENINPEDMELDSEVELEKESQPYSPTDQISRQIAIETELLGIQTSDVSFITPNSQISLCSSTQHLLTPDDANKLERNFRSPDILYYTGTKSTSDVQSTDSVLYLLSGPNETPKVDSSSPQICVTSLSYSPSQPPEISQADVLMSPNFNSAYNGDALSRSQETPYSPTDTPVYDPDLSTVSPLSRIPLLNTVNKSSDQPRKKVYNKPMNQSNLIRINLVSGREEADQLAASSTSQTTNHECPIACSLDSPKMEKGRSSDTSSLLLNIGSAVSSQDSSSSPDSSMVTIDDLPETDLDGSPLVPIPHELQSLEIHIPEDSSHEITEVNQEPLYLRGLPDVTKDINKIPTLVNRSLVPASILRTNKQLQQPWIPKKVETLTEPTFRSAEMQPVCILDEPPKTGTLFKPIKFAPTAKKPPLKIVTVDVFNNSEGSSTSLEGTKEDENIERRKQLSIAKEIAIPAAEEVHNEELMDLLSNVQETVTEVYAIEDIENEKRMRAAKLKFDNVPETNRASGKSTKNDVEVRKPSKPKRRRSMKRKAVESRGETVDNILNQNDQGVESIVHSAITREGYNDGRHEDADIQSLYQQAIDSKRSNKSQKTVGKKRTDQKRGVQKERRDEGENMKVDEETRIQSVGDDAQRLVYTHGHKNPTRDTERQERTEGRSGTDKKNIDDNRIEQIENISKNTNKQAEIYTGDSAPKDTRGTPEEDDEDVIPGKQKQCSGNIATVVSKEGENMQECFGKYAGADVTRDTSDSSGKGSLLVNDQEIIRSTGDPGKAVCSEDKQYSKSENKESRKVKTDPRRRRSSLDEDEESLRAILLASLAKRSKSSEIDVSSPKTTSVLSKLSVSTPVSSTESEKNLSTRKGSKLHTDEVFSPSSSASSPLSGYSSASCLLPCAKFDVPADAKLPRTIPSNDSSDLSTPSPAITRKRTTSATVKGPPKKVLKKMPISLSTRVVNNAKKYQNTLVQKKINLQKVAVMSNSKKRGSCASLNSDKQTDSGRPRTPNTSPSPVIQRFVINLGSDSESDPEAEQQATNIVQTSSSCSVEHRQPLNIPTNDFERSIDLFLKDVRKRQETAAASKPNFPAATSVMKQKYGMGTPIGMKMSPILSTTPLAVRHLPASQQEEYRRLKQQILEREKLKRQRVLESNHSPLSPNSRTNVNSPGPLSPDNPPTSAPTSKHIQIQSAIIGTGNPQPAKDSSVRTVSLAVQVPAVAPAILTQNATNSSSGEVANLGIKTMSTLSIRIPNETSLPDVNKSSSLAVPVQAAKLHISPAFQDASKNKDIPRSAVLTRDQQCFRSVQVQLKQGEVGRRVCLGDVKNTSNEVVKDIARVNGAIDRANQRFTTAPPSSVEKLVPEVNVSNMENIRNDSSRMIDSEASTLSLTQENKKADNSSMTNSSASTIVLPRGQGTDSSVPMLTTSSSRIPCISNMVESSAGIDFPISMTVFPEDRKSSSSISNVLHLMDERGNGNSEIVDSSASTIILPRDEGAGAEDNSGVIDSSVSTIISVREQKIGVEGGNRENTVTVDSSASKMLLPKGQEFSRDAQESVVQSGNSTSRYSRNEVEKRKNSKEIWEKVKEDVRKELDAFATLPDCEQKRYLTENEQKLVAKRYTVLDDLTELSSNLRQLEMERDLQSNMVAEVKKLREQLKLAEQKLQIQKKRVNEMVPNVTVAHDKINNGRRECVKLMRICLGLGSRVYGGHYKVPAAGAQLLHNRLKQVAGSTRQLSKKKVPYSEDSPGVPKQAEHVSMISSPETLSKDSSFETAFIVPTRESSERNIIEGPTVNKALCENTRNIFATEIGPHLRDQDSGSESIETRRENNTLKHKTGKLAKAQSITVTTSVLENQRGALQHDKDFARAVPPLTSTPIISRENVDVAKYQESSLPSTSSRVDCPQAGPSRQKDLREQRVAKILQPYKSVLAHLMLPRIANPDGILCPYELMGTCRDADCQFEHHSVNL